MPSHRFGIEFEFLGSASLSSLDDIAGEIERAIAEIPRHARVAVDDGDYDDEPNDSVVWVVKYDGSCDFEVTTPACTARKWPEIGAVLRALYSAGARTNRSCGLHVHHEVNTFDLAHLRKLWYLWYLYEPVLFGMLAPSRSDNHFCVKYQNWQGLPQRVVRQYMGRDNLSFNYNDYNRPAFDPKSMLTIADSDFRQEIDGRGRYQSLNLTEWWHNGRLEIRAHHGTLRTKDVKFWVNLTQKFIWLPQHINLNDIDSLTKNCTTVADLAQSLSALLQLSDKNTAWHTDIEEVIRRRNPNLLVVPA